MIVRVTSKRFNQSRETGPLGPVDDTDDYKNRAIINPQRRSFLFVNDAVIGIPAPCPLLSKR